MFLSGYVCISFRFQPHRSTRSFETLALHSSCDYLKLFFSDVWKKKFAEFSIFFSDFSVNFKAITQKPIEIGMKFFLPINKQVKVKNSREKYLTGNAQIFLYACFPFRLSPRLNIDRRITKIGTNDHYHEQYRGLKIPRCQSEMAAKNLRRPPKNQDGCHKIKFF